MLSVQGININVADKRGSTALLLAACCGHPETLKALLSLPGIELNAVDKDGKTALMWAAECRRTEALKVLLSAPRINVNAINNWDKGTALIFKIAKENGCTAIIQTLEKKFSFWQRIF